MLSCRDGELREDGRDEVLLRLHNVNLEKTKAAAVRLSFEMKFPTK